MGRGRADVTGAVTCVSVLVVYMVLRVKIVASAVRKCPSVEDASCKLYV